MTKLEIQSELKRLRAQQAKASRDEVFGGFSSQEKAEYDARSKRIRELEAQLDALVLADEASAAQRHEWNKKSETDTPQSEARQPYRERERGSTDSPKTGESKPATKPKPTD